MDIRGKRNGSFKAGAAEQLSCYVVLGRNGGRDDNPSSKVRDTMRKVGGFRIATDACAPVVGADGILREAQFRWEDTFRIPLSRNNPYSRVCAVLQSKGFRDCVHWGRKNQGRAPKVNPFGTGAGEDTRFFKARSRFKALDKVVQSEAQSIFPYLGKLFPAGIPWTALESTPDCRDRQQSHYWHTGDLYYPDSWVIEDNGKSLYACWKECCAWVGFEQAYWFIQDQLVAAAQSDDYDAVDWWTGRQTMLDAWARDEVNGKHASAERIIPDATNNPVAWRADESVATDGAKERVAAALAADVVDADIRALIGGHDGSVDTTDRAPVATTYNMERLLQPEQDKDMIVIVRPVVTVRPDARDEYLRSEYLTEYCG